MESRCKNTELPKLLSARASDESEELKLNDVNYIAKLIHENAVAHGWWEDDRELPEIIALCHSELSEALEAYRNNEPMIWDNNGKPDGIAVEMADCVIRIFDWFGAVGIEPFEIMLKKHRYNETRPYKHGGKKI